MHARSCLDDRRCRPRIARASRRDAAGAQASPRGRPRRHSDAPGRAQHHRAARSSTAGSLASHEQVEKPTVTRLLAVLEERDSSNAPPTRWTAVWPGCRSRRPGGGSSCSAHGVRKDEYLVKRIKGLSLQDQATLEDAAEDNETG